MSAPAPPLLRSALLWAALGCRGEASSPPAAEPPVTASEALPAGLDALTRPLGVGLVAGKARTMAPIEATVTLTGGSSDHGGPRLSTEHSAGTVRIDWGEQSHEQAWESGRPFELWGLQMAVFGASGSYELKVFPPGVPVRP